MMRLCRCFTADVDKYVYEICPYGDSAQKDGQSRTSLGSWKGFKENYSFMSFSGGQVCWNGPQRSMRVRPSPLSHEAAGQSCPMPRVARLDSFCACRSSVYCTTDYTGDSWMALGAGSHS